MDILKIILIINLKRMFDFKNFPIRSVFNILSILIAIACGVSLGIIINAIQEHKIDFKEVQLFDILFIGVIIYTFLRGFLPSYNPIKNITKIIYPLRNTEHFLINVFNDLLKPYYIFTMVMLLSFLTYVEGKHIYYIVSILSALLTAYLARRVVHVLIEFRIKSFVFKLTVYYVGFLLIAIYLFIGKTINLLLVIISLIFLVIINVILHSNVYEYRYFDNDFIVVNSINTKYLKLLFRNVVFRTTFIFQLALHILLLYADWHSYKNYGYHILKSDIIITFIISPISLFASYLNNIFGFFKSFWFTLHKTHSSFSNVIIQIIKLFLIPLIIDIFINITYYKLSDSIKLFSIQYYFSCLIILFSFSILFSLIFPRQIEKAINKRSNVAPIANVISIIIVFLIMYLSVYLKNNLLLVAIFISSIVIVLSFYMYPSSRYKLYQVLYNS